jgi:hypothetical protein
VGRLVWAAIRMLSNGFSRVPLRRVDEGDERYGRSFGRFAPQLTCTSVHLKLDGPAQESVQSNLPLALTGARLSHGMGRNSDVGPRRAQVPKGRKIRGRKIEEENIPAVNIPAFLLRPWPVRSDELTSESLIVRVLSAVGPVLHPLIHAPPEIKSAYRCRRVAFCVLEARNGPDVKFLVEMHDSDK